MDSHSKEGLHDDHGLEKITEESTSFFSLGIDATSKSEKEKEDYLRKEKQFTDSVMQLKGQESSSQNSQKNQEANRRKSGDILDKPGIDGIEDIKKRAAEGRKNRGNSISFGEDVRIPIEEPTNKRHTIYVVPTKRQSRIIAGGSSKDRRSKGYDKLPPILFTGSGAVDVDPNEIGVNLTPDDNIPSLSDDSFYVGGISRDRTMDADDMMSQCTHLDIKEESYITFVRLIEALYTYGAPALHLEDYVDNLRQALRLPHVSIRLGPAGFWASRKRKVEYVAVSKSADIGRLAETVCLIRDISLGNSSNGEILDRLDGIQCKKNIYHLLLKLLTFPLYAIGFTVFFFGGDRTSIYTAFFISIVQIFYQVLSAFGVLKNWSKLQLFIMSFVAGFLPSALSAYGIITTTCGYSAGLGASAIYFPGVTVSFSILEMMQELLIVGGVRFVYSQFIAQVIATAMLAGTAFWYSVVFPELDQAAPPCPSIVDGNQWLRIPFYFLLYIPAIFNYEIPYTLCIPFFLVQATTYFTYYMLATFTRTGDYLATGLAVFVMVCISGTLSHKSIRSRFFPSMTPMATIIPTLELLVPGSTMVKTQLALANNTTSSAVALSFTTISIAIGFLIADATLKTIVPGMKGVLQVPTYKGPFNYLSIDEAMDPYKAQDFITTECHAYIVLLIHRAKNVVPADLNGKSDPYLQMKINGELAARTSTIIATLNPVWNEAFIIPVKLNERNMFAFDLDMFDCDRFLNDDHLGSLHCIYNENTKMMDVGSNNVFLTPSITSEVHRETYFEKRWIPFDNTVSGELEISVAIKTFPPANITTTLTTSTNRTSHTNRTNRTEIGYRPSSVLRKRTTGTNLTQTTYC